MKRNLKSDQNKVHFSFELVEKYINEGYLLHPLPQNFTGVILKHPDFDQQEGERRHTIPIAKMYAFRGQLIVLQIPTLIATGKATISPDGFLNKPENIIEFKHCTSGSANNIYNNLSSASKRGKSLIRSLWITHKAKPTIIAQQLAKKYRSSTRIDVVHIFYKRNMYYFSRDFFLAEGEKGMAQVMINKKTGPYEPVLT